MDAVDAVTPDLKKNLYRTMLRIRRIEEKIAVLYPEQEMRCPTHLYIGQEAVAAGVCANLSKGDSVFGTYRAHGLYLSLGGDLNAMMAELYGKRTGCTRGKGGSMQLIAPDEGLLCTSALVGGTIPMAAGAGLAERLRRSDRVAVAVFGDGGTEEGVFHESLNFASLKKLPVVFVCENNFYAVYTHFSQRQCADNIYERAHAYAMPGVRVDGNDALEVYRAMREAVMRARRGAGPSLIECRTYRWLEHVGASSDVTRDPEELDEWIARCPVRTLQHRLVEEGLLSEEDIHRMKAEVDAEIVAAVRFAKESPFPAPEELEAGVYAP
ncbi:MAG: hypothetical protein A3G34_11705 [Candidatus Lindowbacteria bacterium RIFCSPLOWO2_12_FULL_62_27]|nr:MAG: hypothetical protein A3I06_02270 [Candidatus Lindowbacteria bacterium RIFCSPLOWO2_02_FULL_62_12]OGH60916.1 MAG: hypothetical protein A3G34_11705 [Candidatus Lindowbacteria bacterium RIFCSPLOWO2_12_FULL_62_27]